MTSGLASIDTPKRRPLTDALGLQPGMLPGGGNFYPEEDVLMLLAEKAAASSEIVLCGGGTAAAVAAKATSGRVTILETCARMIQVSERWLDIVGAEACIIETDLEEYDKHNMWYPRHVLNRVPNHVDLLFIDGPGHFAGRMPRWPAGPELFPRLAPSGIVLLDDGRRVKEKKALKRWAEDFPSLRQVKTKTSGGAVLLIPEERRGQKCTY
ncbi:MAG: hypothetical protein AAF557_01885 [Pseudomonadota bacterium]